MPFQSYLQNLRNKPDHIRRRFSLLVSFGFTAIIFVFWISSFGTNKNSNIESVIAKIDSPSQSLVASVGSFFSDIKDIVFGSKKVEYTTIEVRPGRK